MFTPTLHLALSVVLLLVSSDWVCAYAQTSNAVASKRSSNSIGADYLVKKALAEGVSSDPGATDSTAVAETTTPHARESGANTLQVPNPILATGSDVRNDIVSPNAIQLAEQLKLTPKFQHLAELRSRPNLDSAERLEMLELREEIEEIINTVQLEVNYVIAEIYDEQSLYNEVLGAYEQERDKKIAMTNLASFGTNGILWAVAEALTIPTFARPKYAISSGINGILAGIIPSIASAYTLREVAGNKHSAVASPNVLAKLFDRETNQQIDYPESVWVFLHTPPAGRKDGKTRKDVIIDRWVEDKNLASFTDRKSDQQIDLITAAKPQQKTVTIGVLSTRLSMLQQLQSEIYKMNRLLLELQMVLRGKKRL